MDTNMKRSWLSRNTDFLLGAGVALLWICTTKEGFKLSFIWPAKMLVLTILCMWGTMAWISIALRIVG
jgi:hypothetical protein